MNPNMHDENSESIMAKYLENRTNVEENHRVLDHLMKNERDRIIMNLAAAGLRSMQPGCWQFKD